METVGVNVIETAALGRPFQLGMLYDCRKDALIPGITLWDPEKLQQSLRVRPQINTNFKVMASDSIEDKSNLLNIDGSLKLSVLGGLINVTGSAEYLNDTKKSFKQQRLILRYHSTCRVEELTMNHLASEKIVHHEVLDNDTATHVVTAVLYGADACFVFDREVSSDEEISTVKGEAKVALEKLKIISVDVNVNLKMNDTQKNAVQKFTCSFYGDFQLPSNPTSFEDALKVFTDLPNLLGEKKELAVPLRVWLFPLDKLHTRASKLQKDISVDLIMAIESVIESLNTTEMKCNDLLKDSPASTFTEFHDKILQMKKNCYMCKLRLMKKLGSLLPNIRGDVMKETDLNDLLQEHNDSPFSGRDLEEWLKERERESDVIKLILRQLKEAGAQAEVNIDLISMDLDVGNLVCYTFTSLNWSDVLLHKQKAYLSMSAKGETDENSLDSEQKSWLTPEIQKTTRNNLKIFKSLIDSKDRKPAKFIVSSKEMKNNPGSCILLYESECDEAVCFIPPSKPACPISEEVKDNSVVLKVPPSCPATVELRILYKLKQGIIWTSKPVLKDELTVTLTDLRAGTEYKIKCAALGKLNYTVDSDVLSVTTEEGSLITVEAMNTIPKVTRSLTTAEDMRDQTKLMMQPFANWEDYLTPAPLSIAILGELVFISPSTDFSINKRAPKDGYTFIKYPDSFRACLKQVCNSGCWAFNEAHNSMDQIRLYTAQVPDYMKKAVQILFQGDDEVVKAHLPDQLDSIRVIADECLKLSDATEKRFTDVIDAIRELLEGKDFTKSAAISPKPPIMQKEENNSTNMSYSQRAAKDARLKIEQARAQMTQARERYEKCLEKLEKDQNELTAILASMRNSEGEEIDFKTMDAMRREKVHLKKMVQFFQMVSNIVKTSLSNTLTNFVSTSEKTQKLSHNAKLFSKDLLYTQAFQACNIASLVHMISGTYTEISSKNLMGCVSSLDKLTTMDKSKPEFEYERQQLQNACDEAQKGILNCALKNKIEFEMKSTERIEKIDRELLVILPAAHPENFKIIQEAIQSGFSEEEEASYY